MEDAKTAATKAVEKLLDQPEIRSYLVSVLRVAFLEGAVWSQEQRLNQLQAQRTEAEVAHANS